MQTTNKEAKKTRAPAQRVCSFYVHGPPALIGQLPFPRMEWGGSKAHVGTHSAHLTKKVIQNLETAGDSFHTHNS